MNLVGFDIVEVSPAYDTNAELTGMLAADIVQEYFALATKGKTNGGKAWMPAAKGGKLYDERETEKGSKHDEL